MVAPTTYCHDRCLWDVGSLFFHYADKLICVYDVLMRSIVKFSAIVLLVVVSLGMTYLALSYISETYFFDKLYFRKRVSHGYWLPGKKVALEDFGERAEDLIALEKDYQSYTKGQQVLGANTDPDTFTVAIIGDSYVWGQGVRFDDTVSPLLEKKLAQYRKVKVLALSQSGNSILDDLMLYEKAMMLYPVDLYIFVLVDNDLMLFPWKADIYANHEVWKRCQKSYPDEVAVFDFTQEEFESITGLDNKYVATSSVWIDRFTRSWQSPFNLCLLDKSLELLPLDRAIYFISQFHLSPNLEKYINSLNKYGKMVLTVDDSRKLKKYEQYWQNPEKNFNISTVEKHPSRLLHQIYSELLFQEIINNPAWKFTKEETAN